LILRLTGKSDQASRLVTYAESEVLTTKAKLVDCSKAQHDLGLETTIPLEKGIQETIDWMRSYYGLD
jgi:dTDP-glucose 4,6-dehydratase